MKTNLLILFVLLCTTSGLPSYAQVKKPVKTSKAVNTPSVNTVKVTPPTSTIQLENITESLCPKTLVRGDREFDGNGPVIKCEVKLRTARNGTEIWADITFNAKETKHDWSEASGSWSKKVYDAPYGKKVAAILSDKASRTKFISPKAGFQMLVPGADVAAALNGFMDKEPITAAVFAAHGISQNNKQQFSRLITGSINNGNTVVRVPATEGALVKFFHIVGDTGGADISNDDNCNDDTRIVKIEFFPLKVRLEATE